jgi:hypothetical protein
METLGYMNATQTVAGSWEAASRRPWCNGGFREALNPAIRGIFRKFYCVTGDSNSTTTGAANKITDDYFAFAAEKEIFGSKTYSTDNEASALIQFTLYETAANRIKRQGDSGSAIEWWERSPYYQYTVLYLAIIANGGESFDGADHNVALSPYGVIG